MFLHSVSTNSMSSMEHLNFRVSKNYQALFFPQYHHSPQATQAGLVAKADQNIFAATHLRTL
jgi:hypothetical protein